MKIKTAASLGITVLFSAALNAQPSYHVDCAAPDGATQVQICSDPVTIQDYRMLDDAYDALASVPNPKASELANDQYTFITSLKMCQGNQSCLRGLIQYRMNALSDYRDGNFGHMPTVMTPNEGRPQESRNGGMIQLRGVSPSQSQHPADPARDRTDQAGNMPSTAVVDSGPSMIDKILIALVLIPVAVVAYRVWAKYDREVHTCDKCGHYPISISTTDEPRSTYTRQATPTGPKNVYEVGVRRTTTTCPSCGDASISTGRYERNIGATT